MEITLEHKITGAQELVEKGNKLVQLLQEAAELVNEMNLMKVTVSVSE